MARQKIQYRLVGRYVRGNDTVYYGLISENGNEVRYTEEQMAFAVGRDQVVNVKAQLYQNKVLFRGIGCDIKNLPTIQLGGETNSIKTPTQPTSDKGTLHSNEGSTIIKEINNKLDSIIHNYTIIKNFNVDKKLADNVIYIKLTENRDYCGKEKTENIFKVTYKNNYAYILNNNEILYKSSTNGVNGLIKMLLSCICFIRTDIYNSIAKSTDFIDSIADAFEDYSGASNYIDDILRGKGTKNCDEELAPYSMYHACFAMAAYGSGDATKNYNGYLFRGERNFSYETHVEHGFTSTSMSLEVASQFSSTSPNSRILAFKDIRLNDMIDIGTKAVCLANGEPSEYEILLRPEIKVTVYNKIGTYKGIPVHIATAEPLNSKKEEVNNIVDTFVKTYNNESVYGMGLILKNLQPVQDIQTIGYSTSELKIILKNGRTFSLDLGTEHFNANSTEIIGKERIKEAVKSLLTNGELPLFTEDNSGNDEDNTKTGKHVLSEPFISSINEKLGINDFETNDTYEHIIKQLLNKYSSFAYNMEKTMWFSDIHVYSHLPSNIKIVNHLNSIWYIETNVWESSDYVKLAVSETTLQLIKYEYPDIITEEINNNIDIHQYKYCHYHELTIRLGAFSRIPQYKKLKLRFMGYNTDIFDDKIPHDILFMVGEYKQGTHFDDLEGCAGYSKKGDKYSNRSPIIIMKYSCFKSVNDIDNLNRDDTATMLHEMSHAYVDVVYGTNWETDPASMGDVLYGIDKTKHTEQYKCHGLRFGNTIKMVSEKTGLSFDELFRYGVHIDNAKRDTDFTKSLPNDAVYNFSRTNESDLIFTNPDYIVNGKKGSYKTFDYKKSYSNIKKELISKQDKLSQFFMKKFNMQLIFNITDDESRLYTVDSLGTHRYYDINFDSHKTALLLYRLYDANTSVLLHMESVKSTPSAVIKKVLEKVYVDTLQD